MKKGNLLFSVGLITFFCALLFLQVFQLFGFPETVPHFVMGVGIGIELTGVVLIVIGARMKRKEKNSK
ncbi:MAG: hypothetical protein LBC03_05000 [Nitrososphaerota archaeon]|jgi:hypothetical protein|nr:hypothetical protein [Nitrososphaerota archaeon]